MKDSDIDGGIWIQKAQTYYIQFMFYYDILIMLGLSLNNSIQNGYFKFL